jgi:hypothetical protein
MAVELPGGIGRDHRHIRGFRDIGSDVIKDRGDDDVLEVLVINILSAGWDIYVRNPTLLW